MSRRDPLVRLKHMLDYARKDHPQADQAVKCRGHHILTLLTITTCHTAANSNEFDADCQTHAAKEVVRVLSGQPPTTEIKDPRLLAEAQDQGFGGV